MYSLSELLVDVSIVLVTFHSHVSKSHIFVRSVPFSLSLILPEPLILAILLQNLHWAETFHTNYIDIIRLRKKNTINNCFEDVYLCDRFTMIMVSTYKEMNAILSLECILGTIKG